MNKYIFVNLKRFDISPAFGGVNRLAPMSAWAQTIVTTLEQGLSRDEHVLRGMRFPVFFPEAHLLNAVHACDPLAPHPILIGSQSVFSTDTEAGKNFGALTSSLTASAALELGCSWTIIGHSEERAKMLNLLESGGAEHQLARLAVERQLNRQVHAAVKAGLKVLFCVGERSDEVHRTQEVLSHQLQEGLAGIDPEQVVIAYEPIWAIGPGKTPPDAAKIRDLAMLIKSIYPAQVVYGGGLKRENAGAIGTIAELDGGLIALTRFSGEIGFYPDEYLEIVRLYCEGETR